MKRLLVALALSAAIACDETPTSPSDLVNLNWQLVSIARSGSAVIAVPDPARYTIQFTDGGRVAIRSDCNTCGGPYTLSAAALSLGPLACTRAFCGSTSLDSTFTDALAGARSLARTGSELVIRGNDVELRFRN